MGARSERTSRTTGSQRTECSRERRDRNRASAGEASRRLLWAGRSPVCGRRRAISSGRTQQLERAYRRVVRRSSFGQIDGRQPRSSGSQRRWTTCSSGTRLLGKGADTCCSSRFQGPGKSAITSVAAQEPLSRTAPLVSPSYSKRTRTMHARSSTIDGCLTQLRMDFALQGADQRQHERLVGCGAMHVIRFTTSSSARG